MAREQSLKVGEVFITNQSCECIVLEYRNFREVLIKFLDEHQHEMWVQAGNLRNGGIKNPFHKTFIGVGFIGVGEHRSRVNGRVEKVYRVWSNILMRCYCPKEQNRMPTYKGCYVHKDWHNFQNFAAWYEGQYKEDGWEVEKDILVKGNKEYSAKFCRMVPQELNKLFINRGNFRGDLPIGVSRNLGNYQASVSDGGVRYSLGTFKTPEKAFEVYKDRKELIIKREANKFKGRICEDLYQALVNFEVER